MCVYVWKEGDVSLIVGFECDRLGGGGEEQRLHSTWAAVAALSRSVIQAVRQ